MLSNSEGRKNSNRSSCPGTWGIASPPFLQRCCTSIGPSGFCPVDGRVNRLRLPQTDDPSALGALREAWFKLETQVRQFLAGGGQAGCNEITAPEFDLGTRAPRSVGDSVAEAASNLLDRCYAIIRDSRAHLLELVKAVYADDEATMDRLRLRAAMAGAEILADAYYTAFSLAEDAGAASLVPVDTTETARRSMTFEMQRGLRWQWPGIEMQVEQPFEKSGEARHRRPGTALLFPGT